MLLQKECYSAAESRVNTLLLHTFFRGNIQKTDPKILLVYEEKLKKENPEPGIKGFKTDGADDLFDPQTFKGLRANSGGDSHRRGKGWEEGFS